MDKSTFGLLILILILILSAVILKLGGFKVVYPHARILRLFGRPFAVKNKPGYGWLPPVKFVADGVTLPGTWLRMDLPKGPVLTSDGVQAELEVDVQYRIKRKPMDDPKLAKKLETVMDPRAAIRFQSSWRPGEIEEAVAQIVFATSETVTRRYKSTSLQQSRVLAELTRALEKALDGIGDDWGVDFKPQVIALQANAVIQATEAKVRAQIAKAERLAEAQGLQEAVSFLESSLGNSPHAKAVVSTFLTQQKLKSLPKGTTLVDVGQDVLGSLAGFVGTRIEEKTRRRR